MLRSPSAGKLLQYLVEDGGHVCAGETYAEIEVNVEVVVVVVFTFLCMHCVFIDWLCVVDSGDEDGDDIDCAAVWLYLLCQKTWSSSGTWLYGGPYGVR